jgi:hypothetical protein
LARSALAIAPTAEAPAAAVGISGFRAKRTLDARMKRA